MKKGLQEHDSSLDIFDTVKVSAERNKTDYRQLNTHRSVYSEPDKHGKRACVNERR